MWNGLFLYAPRVRQSTNYGTTDQGKLAVKTVVEYWATQTIRSVTRSDSREAPQPLGLRHVS
jgi:hypothetical protein